MNTKKNTKKNGAKKTYTKITIAGRLSKIIARAAAVAGFDNEISDAIVDFEIEEDERRPGTWWVNLWVANDLERRAVVWAYSFAAAENKANATPNDDNITKKETQGLHKGRYPLSIYIADRFAA